MDGITSGPLVATNEMANIRALVFRELGGWNNPDWVGSYDKRFAPYDRRYKPNQGLVKFCAAFKLRNPYDLEPISEADEDRFFAIAEATMPLREEADRAEAVAKAVESDPKSTHEDVRLARIAEANAWAALAQALSRGEPKVEDVPATHRLWHDLYGANDTERLVGIPRNALFDHAGSHEFAFNGWPDGLVVAFPYLLALKDYVRQLPVLVKYLEKCGMRVCCIADGWWNPQTVGLAFYPQGSGFETLVPSFVAPSQNTSQASSLRIASQIAGGLSDVRRMVDEAPHNGFYVPPDPAKLPRREWLKKPSYRPKTISMLGAPGAAGKSSLMVVEALSLASGKRLLHARTPEKKCKVCMFNAEDSADELDLRIAAAMQVHGLEPRDIEGHLLILPETSRITLVASGRSGGAEILHREVDDFVTLLKEHEIDVLMLDPMAMLHHADENSNSDMTLFMEALLRIAREANVAIRVAHHTKKMGGDRAGIESFRGATALINNSRQGDIINGASAEEAAKLSIPEKDRSRYFSLGNLKSNYGPREGDDWFEIFPVQLPNGETVATVKEWSPPKVKLEYEKAAKIFAMVKQAEKPFRGDQRSPGWLGWHIAKLLKIEGWEDKSPAAKRVAILWLRSLTNVGVIVETLVTVGRKERPAYEAGRAPTPEEWEK